MDPYRSTLATIAIKEGLLRIPDGVQSNQLPVHFRENNDDAQRSLLQLLLLFDDVVIVQNETANLREKSEKIGLPTLSWLPARAANLVKFSSDVHTATPDPEMDVFDGNDPMEFMKWNWRRNRDVLRAWESILVQEIIAKKYLPHKSLFDVFREHRLGTSETLERAIDRVPSEYLDPVIFHGLFNNYQYDMAFHGMLNQFIEAEQLVYKSGLRVAHMSFDKTHFESDDDIRSSERVVEIVLDELLEDQLTLPVPRDLNHLQTLRDATDLKDFRSFFHNWLDKLTSGDLDQEKALRREVKLCLRFFKHHPALSQASKVCSYASIPVALDHHAWSPYLGAGLKFAGLGLSDLSKRWQDRCKWLGFSEKVKKAA